MSSKGLTISDIKKYIGIFFKKGISFEEFDINDGLIEVGDICKYKFQQRQSKISINNNNYLSIK